MIKTQNLSPEHLAIQHPAFSAWLSAHQQELNILYPNQYLLVAIPTGVIAHADNVQLLYKELTALESAGSFSEEDLKQPCYLVHTANTGLGDRSKWGQA